jgi:hypothetical protein
MGVLEGRVAIITGAGRGLGRTFEFVTEPVRDDAGKVRRSALRDARTAT